MKPVPILLALITLGLAFGAVSWFSQSSVPVSNNEAKANVKEAPEEEPAPKENPLEISETGPYPKAVLENGMHEFGSMELGQKLSHKFVVRNEGEAPLLLKKGKVQCKCTIPHAPDEPIPPGESVEIELTWEPKAATVEFHQMAEIWTNDPENQKLELHVKGAVERMFYLLPSGEWQVNKFNDDDPMTFTGIIVSPLAEEFQIADYTSSSDALTAEFEPLTPEELKEHGAKSGYRVNGTISGKTPIGKFRELFTINTDLAGGRDLAVYLSGFFPGPFSIIGKNWMGSEMLLRLGRIRASEGKTATLSLFTPRRDEPMEFQVQEADPAFLELKVERDESFDVAARERYLMTFTVPPGSQVGSWSGEHVGKLRIKTNREDADAFDIFVEMTVVE